MFLMPICYKYFTIIISGSEILSPNPFRTSDKIAGNLNILSRNFLSKEAKLVTKFWRVNMQVKKRPKENLFASHQIIHCLPHALLSLCYFNIVLPYALFKTSSF